MDLAFLPVIRKQPVKFIMLIKSMRSRIISFLIGLLIVNICHAQKIVVSGYVVDESSGEYLIGASIYNTSSQTGSITNKYGFFNIKAEAGNPCCLHTSYVGYTPNEVCFNPVSDTLVKIKILAGTYLEEVQVLATHKEKLEQRTEISKVEIPLKQIKTLPSLTGEADILKAYQLMPGIQMGSEGNNGLFVRGGTPDQNLFLLDDVPLYNVSHLGGLFSVFDPSMVKSVDLYKGGFPARYGGRISSVVDVRNKDGNLTERHGEAGLGIFLSKLFLEGPIVKDKASYALSVRRCNLDIYSFLGGRLLGNTDIPGYTFYDINLKTNYILSNKDRLFLSFYQGNDKFFFQMKEKVQVALDEYEYIAKHNTTWGNRILNLRWFHIIKDKFFNNTTLSYSRYQYINYNISEKKDLPEKNTSLFDEYQFLSNVQDVLIKSEMEVPLNKSTLRFGASYTKHFFNPGSVSYTQRVVMEQLDTVLNSPEPELNLTADELAGYVEYTWNIKEKLSGNMGVRTDYYNVNNKGFASVEPRILLNYLMLKNFSLKASYCTMQQNLHLLSNSNAGLPSDLWIPSTELIGPEKSQQLAIGLAHTTKNNLEISLEGYIKKLNNLIEYKEGVLIYGSSLTWDEKIETNGTGTIKGVELLIQRTEGRLTGWVGYTLSKNERQFSNLNQGRKFPYLYDQRHAIAVVVNYDLNKKISFSGTWVYHTGQAITLPTGKYELINVNYTDSYSGDRSIINDVHIYSEKNGYRMPDYHRLDLGFNFTKPKKRGISKWSLGIYNVYNRQNAYYLYFRKKDGQIHLYQQSIFPILVNFGYSFAF
jgi:outer membrane receptor protein involved in Fe transport